MPVYFYDPPDRFVAGAVGQPGERIFYLQATSSGRVTSVVLEKFQVSLLAERIDELLDEVLRRTGGSPDVPAVIPAGPQDDAPLDLPLLEDFRVGAIALAWDGDGGMVVIEAQEESDEPVEPLAEDLPADGPGVLRVRITPGAARAFAQRAAKIVAAGRPRARCAACRWIPTDTCARGRTVTAPAMLEQKRSGPDDDDGERATLDLLASGKLEIEGRIVDASNATLYCTIMTSGRNLKTSKTAKVAQAGSNPSRQVACVYKPIAGERPLWDFPMGTLAGREVAAYVVSRAAGWDVVPPTVMRDGPFGPGMCQLWIDYDTDVDLIALSRRNDHAGLRDMAVFDAVVNNADRKIGHLLPVADGHLYGCDHGVCFAEDYKLRTVLWQWRGKTLPRRSLEALRRLNTQLNDGGLEAELSSLLSASEIAATKIRVETLLKHRVHPYPPADWPAVPWPPV